MGSTYCASYKLKKDKYIYIQHPYIHIHCDNMGNVLISLDEEHEKLLRDLAQEKYQGKKGSISMVVSNALDNAKKDDDMVEFEKHIERLKKKGIASGYKMYKKRSEIYDD